MAFEAKDLAFKIVDGKPEGVNVNFRRDTYSDLRIVCGTGTNGARADFEGTMDMNSLEALRDAMQATLNEIAKELKPNVSAPPLS